MNLDIRLLALTHGVRPRIAGSVALGLLSAVLGAGRLALLGWLLAQVFRGAPVDSMLWPFIGVAAVMVLRAVLEHWRHMIAHETAARVQFDLRRLLYDKVVELGPAHFGQQRTGEVITSLIEGVEQLETWFGQYLPHVLVCALTPFLIFAFMAFLDVTVAAVLLSGALFTMFAPSVMRSWDRGTSKRRAKAYGDFAAEFLDSVQGLATLKAFGQSTARGEMLAEKAHDVFRKTMWILAFNSASRGITDTGIAIATAAALAVGAYKVVAGEIPMVSLLIVLMMGVELFRPLRELRELTHKGMLGQAAARSLCAILDTEPVIRDSDPGPAAVLPSTVAFEDVDFAYPGGRSSAHRGLSFQIEEGERVAFVGPSGAGKSTIVRLLLRFYDPQSGSVRLGGKDLRDLSFDEIRRQMAVLSQDTFLFHGTVADNLRFGKPDATQEELEAAARIANAHEFIRRMPQGYDTVIGERGLRLSGGQRQRVAIARALLRDKPILILDEALSSVDSENESVILEALRRLMADRTTLIFAHRLSSVRDADRIFVLDDGHIVETGDHMTLMANRGAYHALMAEQAGAEIDTDDIIAATVPSGPACGADLPGYEHEAQHEPTDAILRAEGLGWWGAIGMLMRLVAPWKVQLTVTFLFGVVRVLAFIGVGVAGAMAVAALKQGQPHESYLIALAVVAPLAGLLHWLESWLAHDMAFRLLSEMRIALFEKLDKLSPAYLLRRRTGDLVGMATHDVELVEYFFAHTITPAVVAVLVPAAVIALLVVFGWPLAVALAPFLLAVAISPFLLRERIDRLGSRAREALGELNAHAADTVQGLGEIVAFQQATRRGTEFLDKVGDHHRIRLPFFRDLTLQQVGVELATGLGGLAVVVVGAHLVQAGELERAILPLLVLLSMSAFLPVSEISNIGRQLADTLGSTRRLYAVHNEPVVVDDGPGVASLKREGGVPVALENVAFSYPGTRRRALDGVTLEAAAGKTLALVGPSGAGKTTCANMILRFWDPQHGRVVLGGHDLKDFNLEDLRHDIALVAQDTYLFNTTLRDNILIARPEATTEEVEAAVRRAALEEFVGSLPQGLDTPVGERGVQLSGGQRQRVAIARAFLRDAPVLILDEATSHLDAVNERLVHGALEELMADRTTIVIAHRLSTVRNADRIAVLDQGRLVEAGTHEALLARGGLYAHLVARQMSAASAAAAE